MRSLVIAAVTVGALAMPPVAQAQATPEPCEPGRPALLGVSVPAKVAIDRPAYAEQKNASYVGEWEVELDSGRGFFVPADPGGRLTFAYRDTEPLSLFLAAWSFQFAEGDGPALVGLSYEEYDFVPGGMERRCLRVVSAPVEQIEGRQPALDRHVSSRAGEVEISIDRPFCEDCYKFATGPVRVSFRGPGGARTVAINDQCGHLTKTGGHRQGWQLRGLYRYGTFYASFKDLFRRTGQRTFSSTSQPSCSSVSWTSRAPVIDSTTPQTGSR